MTQIAYVVKLGRRDEFPSEVQQRMRAIVTSSLPVPDNAIYRLAAALQRLSNFGFPLKTNEVTAEYFRRMAKIDTSSAKDDLAKVADVRRRPCTE